MNQKNHWLKAVSLALCTALLLSGCTGGEKSSGNDSSAEKTNTSASSSGGTSSDAPKDYSKYNKYLDIAEVIREDIEPILSVYFENVDYAAEFTVVGDYGAIKDAVDFYTSFTYPVEQAMDYAKQDPAYPKADAAITAMGDSMIQVMDVLGELASYMRFGEYEKDNMAKAPEIHAALWDALEVYDLYYMDYLAAIDEMAGGHRDEDLAELLEKEDMILYYSLSMIHTSEDILDIIWDQVMAANAEAGPEDEVILPEIDMTELSPMFGQFQTSYDGLMGALDTQEERDKIRSFSGAVADSAIKLYKNKVDSLYGRVGSLAGNLLEGEDYSESFDKVSEAIDSMIDGYNSII